MCELAFAPLRGVELCMIERELPAPNYTLHTLQALAKRYPDVQLRLLAGSDLQAETHAWHDFEAIEKLAPPLWIARQGSAPIAGEPMMPDVSSTEVRRRLAAGESTSSLLSPAVAEYIRAHALYQ
jgi:nicotinate-nucleotide adenylyltransferase